jgi:hypothetical protein
MGELQIFFWSLFAVDSIWSVVFRGAIWLVVAVIVIINSNTPNPQKAMPKLKAQLGSFLLFLTLSSGLLFMLFSYSPGQ